MYGPHLLQAANPSRAPKDNCLGCHPTKPVKGCWVIKDKFPDKKSGFYWILPHCAKTPMRVYCNFDTEWN
jgi:hypothetical protein